MIDGIIIVGHRCESEEGTPEPNLLMVAMDLISWIAVCEQLECNTRSSLLCRPTQSLNHDISLCFTIISQDQPQTHSHRNLGSKRENLQARLEEHKFVPHTDNRQRAEKQPYDACIAPKTIASTNTQDVTWSRPLT